MIRNTKAEGIGIRVCASKLGSRVFAEIPEVSGPWSWFGVAQLAATLGIAAGEVGKCTLCIGSALVVHAKATTTAQERQATGAGRCAFCTAASGVTSLMATAEGGLKSDAGQPTLAKERCSVCVGGVARLTFAFLDGFLAFAIFSASQICAFITNFEGLGVVACFVAVVAFVGLYGGFCALFGGVVTIQPRLLALANALFGSGKAALLIFG